MKRLKGGFSGAKVYKAFGLVLKTNQSKDASISSQRNINAAEQYGFNYPAVYYAKNKTSVYQYVEGKTIAELLLQNSSEVDVQEALQKIINVFKSIENKERLPDYNFFHKLNDLCKVKKISDVVKRLPRFNKIESLYNPVYKAHGDLTLSNIILDTQGHIYLIDGNQNYWQDNLLTDVSKLLQDSRSRWFCHLEEKKISIKNDNLIKGFSEELLSFGYETWPLEVMDFLRIMRYSKEKKHDDFAIQSIKHLCDNVQRGF